MIQKLNNYLAQDYFMKHMKIIANFNKFFKKANFHFKFIHF